MDVSTNDYFTSLSNHNISLSFYKQFPSSIDLNILQLRIELFNRLRCTIK